MKEIIFDTMLVAANPHSDHTNTFVSKTMQRIRLQDQKLPAQKTGLFTRLKRLHAPAMALLVVALLALLSGVVYAAILFAPDFIKIIGKDTTKRGTAEYSVTGFNDCAKEDMQVDRFEINSEAPQLSDEEVQKIIQAKCELKWLAQFPGKMWPTYGTNPEWKDGDTIYYTRTDILGKLKYVKSEGAGITHGREQIPIDYKTVGGEQLKAYHRGVEVPIGDLQPGDTVFTIVRASETYWDPSKYFMNPDSTSQTPPPTDNNMKTLGLIALFKLTLPYEYYLEKQNYLTEVPVCMGNDGEYCPSTPWIDIYPRSGGEGAANPHLVASQDSAFREISGTVTELSDDRLTLKSRSGNIYTVTVGDAGFKEYNRVYTGAYDDVDATLRVGSTVGVRYAQPKNADPKTIAKEHVMSIGLMLESLDPKRGSIKQY
jgi:hypothetical protein